MCSVNGSTLLPQRDDDERNPLRHQTGNERDVTAEPVELGDGNFTLRLLRRLQGRLQLRPTVERVRTLAGLDLGELGDDLEAFGLGERWRRPCAGLRGRGRNGPASGSRRDNSRSGATYPGIRETHVRPYICPSRMQGAPNPVFAALLAPCPSRRGTIPGSRPAISSSPKKTRRSRHSRPDLRDGPRSGDRSAASPSS